ncbi:conserved hypothetical protein [Rhodobacteraceae bacterium KLH11]|nr:conserved hypothetical protein [Rhodobacteraceae bacterium KLH11]
MAGGTNIPNAAELLAGMPDALRHQNRALSLSDLEAIARNFDTDITQVRAEHTKDQPGLIRVHVLAKGKTRTRVYSAARREALGKALASRMSDAYGADCLDVRSVEFVRHQITISLRAAPGHSGAVETEAKRILTAFFDPARGGPYGNGWPVGRPVWPLDIDRVLRDINGLESIIGIEIARHDELQPDAISSYQVVFTAFAEDLNVIMSEGEAP